MYQIYNINHINVTAFDVDMYKRPADDVPSRSSQLTASEAHWEALFFGQLHSKSSTENLESLGI